jgi:uncharacterized protein
MSLQTCPNCSDILGAPLSSGRQVCRSCGWSDQPRSPGARGHAQVVSSDVGMRQALSALCHGAIFLTPIVGFPIIIPIVLLFASNDSVVKANAKEAIHFQIYSTVIIILAAIAMVFCAMVFPGLALLLLVLVVVAVIGCLVLPILAIVSIYQSPDDLFTYPLIERMF